MLSHWEGRKSNIMTKIFYYDDVKVIKKPLSKRIKPFLIFFVFVVFCGGICFLGMHLSRSLAVGNISTIFVYGGTNIKCDKKEMYAVAMGKYEKVSDAEKVALGATIQGAGGYLWKDDDYYYVLGSVYADSESADSVAKNLSGTNYDISVLKISMPKVALSFDDLEPKSVSTIRDAIEFFDTCYQKIYDYTISFDKSEANNLGVSSSLSELRGDLKVYISTIQSINSSGNAKIQEVINGLIRLDELLDQAIIKTIDNSSTSSYLKYTLCSIVNIELGMRNALA